MLQLTDNQYTNHLNCTKLKMKILGNNIRKIRELRGLTQKQVSEKLGMTQGNYARLEKGEIKIAEERLGKIASILDCNSSRIKEFNAEELFARESGGEMLPGSKPPYISPQIKKMYEDRIEHLEGFIQSLKTELELLKK